MRPERPCSTCRWAEDGFCQIRQNRRGRKLHAVKPLLPLPADGGASCPPRLWSPREERLVYEPQGESSIVRCSEEQEILGRENLGQFTRDLAASMARLGMPDLDTAEARHRWRGDTRVDRFF